MMAESGSPMLLPYETHYLFLLIALYCITLNTA